MTRPLTSHHGRADGPLLRRGPRRVCRDPLPPQGRGLPRGGGTEGIMPGATPYLFRPRSRRTTAVGAPPPPLTRKKIGSRSKGQHLGGRLSHSNKPPPPTVAATCPYAGPFPCQHFLLSQTFQKSVLVTPPPHRHRPPPAHHPQPECLVLLPPPGIPRSPRPPRRSRRSQPRATRRQMWLRRHACSGEAGVDSWTPGVTWHPLPYP